MCVPISSVAGRRRQSESEKRMSHVACGSNIDTESSGYVASTKIGSAELRVGSPRTVHGSD